MPLVYGIPTLNSFDHCQKAVETILAGSLVPDYIIIIDNSGTEAGARYLDPLLKDERIDIWPQPRNIGVAASWNLLLDAFDDYVIIGNDDVFPHHDSVRLLVSSADQHKNDYLFCGPNTSGNAFSFFLFKNEGYKLVGPFDELFWPAYFEDNDMAHRIGLMGLKIITVPDASFDHVGSSTLARYTAAEKEQHHRTFRANQSRYRAKWGGMPGHETFTKEFNGM